MTTLGSRIRIARGTTSQDAFAKKIHVSKGSLGFYERDENLPNTDVVLRICSETGVSLAWLLLGAGSIRSGEHAAHLACPQELKTPEQDTQGYAQCERCQTLEKRLDAMESERRELSTENRQLLKENGMLKLENLSLTHQLDFAHKIRNELEKTLLTVKKDDASL